MSIWVRLIGGLHDGEVVKIDDDQVEIVLRRQVPMVVTHPHRVAHGISSNIARVIYTHYTRRIVVTPGGSVTYFALESFSDFEALQHVLGP